MLPWLIGIILGEIICESSNWQHIQRLKITILGANWQLFRLEKIAKFSYFLFTQIKFYWFVMKIKKFLLPIWWYNRGLFPFGNKYFWVFVLNGLRSMFLNYFVQWQMVALSTLWEKQACIIHFMRRFGWPACRLGASELSSLKPQLDEADIRLVGVGLEDLGAQDFVDGKFWQGGGLVIFKKICSTLFLLFDFFFMYNTLSVNRNLSLLQSDTH